MRPPEPVASSPPLEAAGVPSPPQAGPTRPVYVLATRAVSGGSLACSRSTTPRGGKKTKACNDRVEDGELRLVLLSHDQHKSVVHMRCVGPTQRRVILDGGGVSALPGFADLSDAHKEEAKAAIHAPQGFLQRVAQRPAAQIPPQKPSHQKPSQKPSPHSQSRATEEPIFDSSSGSSSSSSSDGDSDAGSAWSQRGPAKKRRAAPAPAAFAFTEGARKRAPAPAAQQPAPAAAPRPSLHERATQQMIENHSVMLQLFREGKVPLEALQQSMALVASQQALASAESKP